MLDLIWFFILALAGYVFAFRYYKNSDDLDADHGMPIILSFGAMLLAIPFLWNFLGNPTTQHLSNILPQGSPVSQELTTYVLLGLVGIFWTAHQFFVVGFLYNHFQMRKQNQLKEV